ncbi:hypothetical protein QOT17_021954 [Balamuthia mandrillaris]
MLAHWALVILYYNFEVFHQPGIHHILEDSLLQLYAPSILSNALLNNAKTLAPKPKINNIKLDDSQLSAPSCSLNNFIKDLLSKTVLPPNKCQSILERLHSIGSEGAESLLHKVVKEGCFWPNIRHDCHNTACHCKECLHFNITQLGFHPLKSIHATFPFEHIAINPL